MGDGGESESKRAERARTRDTEGARDRKGGLHRLLTLIECDTVTAL